MAKTKEDKIEKFNIKNFEKCFTTPSELIDKPRKIIPITYSLDQALGGGIIEGTPVIFTGPPKLGKTSAVLQLCSNAQKEEYGGKKIFYLNIEGRIKKRDLQGIVGLDLSDEKFIIIESKEEKVLYAHDYLDIALHLLKTEKNCIVVLDSISQLCSEGRTLGSTGERFRDDTPLMIASFTRQAGHILPLYSNILVSITHIIANQGAGHSLWMESSGQKIQYLVESKVKGTHTTPYMVGEDQVGQEVHWIVECSALGKPKVKCTSLLRYGIGFDKEYDIINTSEEIGLIKKGGSWYTIENEKIQGIEKACEYLRANPDVYKTLETKLKEVLK